MLNGKFDFCIVGAGPSGLTLAYKLLNAGKTGIVIERDERPGGLAKSYNYNGHIFDTGPKRFHTDDPKVLDFIIHVLEEDYVTIDRSTMVYFLNRYYNWPLTTKDVFKLPIRTSIKCFSDLLFKQELKDKNSFSDYVKAKYGNTLYNLFFEPYTKKFLQWEPSDIHSDWASTGINRTTIDSRIKKDTLFDLLKHLTLPEKIKTEFIYPTYGGFGDFFDKLFSLCKANKGFQYSFSDQITKITKIKDDFELVTQKNNKIYCSDLIWSGNLNDLSKLIDCDETHLNYLNTIFYNIICKDEGINPKYKSQWIYVSKGDSLISRITCMKEFSPTTTPEGYYNF
ncbi:MAG: NAD(P)-binding protein, partial [Leptospiraceae bacterium]|nr:NAD(P)-binding protein [Leptospiraceae bacterium]